MTYQYKATPQPKNSSPGVMKFTIQVDPYNTCTHNCLIHVPVQTRRGVEIFHFHSMAMPQHKNPCPGLMKFYNFGRLFLSHHYMYYILTLSDLCLGVEKILTEIMHFHYMCNMPMPQHKNPCPKGNEIYNFGRPFFGHHNCILTLSDVCLGVETIVKERIHFHYTSYMAMPEHKNPAQRVMKFAILVDPSLVIITIYLVCLNHFQKQKRRLKKKQNITFILFTLNLPPPLSGGGVTKFIISCLLTIQMLHTKFGY